MKLSKPIYRFALFVAVLWMVSLACQPVEEFSDPTEVPAWTEEAEVVQAVKPTLEEEIELPTLDLQEDEPAATQMPLPTQQDPEPVKVDQIIVDYTYTIQLITLIYHLYGSLLEDYAIITITNENTVPVRVVVQTEVMGYTDSAMNTIDIAAGDTVEVRQNPTLLMEAVDRLNTQKDASFHIRVIYLKEGEERQILDETQEIVVYGKRDFPLWLEGFTSQEIFELWSAMVTPNDPAIERLIREAADYNPDGLMISGYAGIEHDAEWKVWNRLEAIWKAEQEIYQLTYISTWVSFAPGSVQRIRLPSEVLAQNSGNCIELALVYASAAEALGLEAALIAVPGHAFVAIRTDKVNASYYFIETTLIAESDFSTAVEVGGREFEEALPNIELDDPDDSWAWVTIQEARELGILPVPWQ